MLPNPQLISIPEIRWEYAHQQSNGHGMLRTENLGLLFHRCLTMVLRLKTHGFIHSLMIYHGISDILLKDADRALTFNRVYPQGIAYIEREVAAVESPQSASPSCLSNTVL